MFLFFGKIWFFVCGFFELDRDVVDYSEECIVMYIGKMMFVDFYLKLRFNDLIKFFDGIGKVFIYGVEDV